MAKSFGIVLPFFLAFCALSHGINVLNETISCRSQCERTYSLHTYPTVRHCRACQQGCYKAVKIKAWSVLGFRLHMNCSELACIGQYFEPDSLYACKLGCEKGKDVSNNAKKVPTSSGKTIPTENREQRNTVAAIILRPVMLMRTYGRGMINKLAYYVQSSTSYYFSTNNGGIVVVNIQSEPEIYISSSNSDYNDMPITQNDEPQKQKEIKGHSYTEQHESWIVVRRGHHWLHCVSHKSGVPMWILSSILFLSSFFLLWLCCAASTSRSASKKSEKKAFLIKDFLSASKEKSGQDVPLLKLNDDEEQAGPLPPKTGSAVINM